MTKEQLKALKVGDMVIEKIASSLASKIGATYKIIEIIDNNNCEIIDDPDFKNLNWRIKEGINYMFRLVKENTNMHSLLSGNCMLLNFNILPND